jgi:hypothetical protein
MKNLAGDKDADLYIQEELILAGIPLVRGDISRGEVPYTITGKLGDWSFNRAWYYWVASAPECKGLPLEAAAQMHEKNYPVLGEGQPTHYGDVIRVVGHCGCPHPKDWAEHFDEQGRALAYDPKGESERYFKEFILNGVLTQEATDSTHFVHTREELEKLTSKAFIDLYHVDSQLGLNELARVIRG